MFFSALNHLLLQSPRASYLPILDFARFVPQRSARAFNKNEKLPLIKDTSRIFNANNDECVHPEFFGQCTILVQTIIAFLVLNPVLLYVAGPYITGWALVLEFIFTLAMALKCYPLQPGGLLAIEGVVMGMTSPDTVYHEVLAAFPVILLLVFMVAGIYFMKELLLFTFTKVLLSIRSKTLISFLFCFISAFLSAFLDALTVTAVVISVAVGFYAVYKNVADQQSDAEDPDFEKFRAFLRNLLMHACGYSVGGRMHDGRRATEPSDRQLHWMEFCRVLPAYGSCDDASTCRWIDHLPCARKKTKIFGYGAQMPPRVRDILVDYDQTEAAKRTDLDVARLVIQAISAMVLILALGFHVAEVGLIGLTIIVLQTAFNGVIQEHDLGKAFEEALPFTALLVVFFGIVGVIHEQHLFSPRAIAYVLSLPEQAQPGMFYASPMACYLPSVTTYSSQRFISARSSKLSLTG